MPNRQYEQGDRFEKRVMNDLEPVGYKVWQTRGSKGAADLVGLATRPWVGGTPLLVQVKSGDKITTHAAWNELYDLAGDVGGLPLIADRDGRKIRYRLITGYHTYRSRDWPAEEYTP